METTVRRGREQADTTPAGSVGTAFSSRAPVTATSLRAKRALVKRLQRELAEALRDLSAAEQAREPVRIQRAKEFIAQNLAEPLTVEIVARHVNLSPSQFSRRWNQVTGASLTEYLARQRVERAKVLLRDTDGKVFDIALDAGFQSEAAFYRWFGKLTGQSPQEYRRALAR